MGQEKIEDLSNYNVIFNTIPHSVLSQNSISSIDKGALIIDLASKNSLLCESSANYIDASALPSKYCMQSSANALLHFLNKHLATKYCER